MDNKTIRRWFFILILFAILEFLMIGNLQGYFGIYYSPIIFFIASINVSTASLYAAFHLPSKEISLSNKNNWPFFILLPFVLILLYFGYSIFSTIPIDDSNSDVFAQVLSPAKWLLNGEYPYQKVVLPTYTMDNTYLPMQWLLFVLPVGFGFDPRWIPIGVWSVAIMVFTFLISNRSLQPNLKNILVTILVCALVVYSMIGFIAKNGKEYSITLEMLPTAYYIILVLTLLRGNWQMIGFSMGLCLMSRFSILLFLPFIAWYIWKRFGATTLRKSSIMTIVFILVVFVLPFMTIDHELPFKIIHNYDTGAYGEWQTHGWQNPNEEPYQLSRGTGAAIFIKKLYEYDVKDGIQHLKQVGLFTSVLVGLFMIYLFQRNKSFLNMDWILLGGIKLFFTVFYTLVLIPYPYLFVLPITITGLILLKALKDTSQLSQVST